MDELLENDYFNWLCAKIVDTRRLNMDRALLATLYRTEFVSHWRVMGDDNRAADGKELRGRFLIDTGLEDDPSWRGELGCSVLEMLVAFAYRAEWMTDEPAANWFWEFIENLGLSSDTRASSISEQEIKEALDIFMWRLYDSDGRGGLFPLQNPLQDQREVEIWYQFCNYLVDQNRLP